MNGFGKALLSLAAASGLITAGVYLCTPSSITASPSRKFALVRPATPHDVQELVESFDLWDEYAPCTEGADGELLGYKVDLVISLSRRDTNNLKADAEVLQGLHDKFDESRHEWSKCFSSLQIFDAKLTEEEDIYNVASQKTNPLWVNGPNLQFRSTFGHLRDSDYDFMFLMEADTFPWANGWLDSLLTEVSSQSSESSSFGILGSKYRGSAWDGFRDKIPVALREHVNGNAVYNLKNPLLNDVVKELEQEQDNYFKAVPYDYRISQIAMEASQGVASTFPFPTLLTNIDESQLLPHKQAHFKDMWKHHAKAAKTFIVQSKVVANYGINHAVHDKVVGGFAIVHGKQYDPRTVSSETASSTSSNASSSASSAAAPVATGEKHRRLRSRALVGSEIDMNLASDVAGRLLQTDYGLDHFKSTVEKSSTTDVPVLWDISPSSTEFLKAAVFECDNSEKPLPSLESTADLYEANDKFSHKMMGRLFALFRHPVHRALEHYQGIVDKEGQQLSLMDYASSDQVQANWMTRRLISDEAGDNEEDSLDEDTPLTDDDLEVALHVLRSKFVVGLHEKLPESLSRFQEWFHWDIEQECTVELEEDITMPIATSIAKLVTGHDKDSKELQLLAEANKYDIILYEEAKKMFDSQASWFSSA